MTGFGCGDFLVCCVVVAVWARVMGGGGVGVGGGRR